LFEIIQRIIFVFVRILFEIKQRIIFNFIRILIQWFSNSVLASDAYGQIRNHFRKFVVKILLYESKFKGGGFFHF